jgi:16S rRNA processing protein RimM
VMAVHNYGGGPFLEIGTNKKDSFMLPFTKECVPEVDMKGGKVTIDPPEGWP